MLTYRTFRNSDPPVLAALWQSRAGQSGLPLSVTPDLLDQLVFAKLYFDYPGLTLAWEDDQPVGFAHAGFGPNAEQNWISTDTGATCMVLVRPDCAEDAVADGLVDRCEKYLRGRGAKVLFGGGLYPTGPFYVGLHSGSELPGVLDSDQTAKRVFAARGYQEIERMTRLRRELGGFESLVDRRQMQVRRQMLVEVTVDAPTHTWWEACTMGPFELTRFDLVPRGGGSTVASASFRSMEPSGTATVGRAVSLIGVSVDPSYRRRGLALFLLSEAFRQFLRQGIVHVDVQAQQTNIVAIAMLGKLGFQQVEQGGLWRKDV